MSGFVVVDIRVCRADARSSVLKSDLVSRACACVLCVHEGSCFLLDDGGVRVESGSKVSSKLVKRKGLEVFARKEACPPREYLSWSGLKVVYFCSAVCPIEAASLASP